jgi:hypothetical protein
MATFQQIYANIFFGLVICSLSLIAFGFAIRWEFNSQLAPRTWSRPRAVLKNVLQPGYFYSWWPWAMKLSYPDLLEGIPGTGTRQNGWAGPMLKCNLDGIIMLRFNVMLLRISIVATILCIAVLLPVFYTAGCDPEVLGIGTCKPLENLTNFEQCTIINIPRLEYNNSASHVPDETDDGYWLQRESYFIPGVTGRYASVVIVSFVIYIYACGTLQAFESQRILFSKRNL